MEDQDNLENALILRNFEIEIPEKEVLSDEEVFKILSEQVAYMMEHKMEYLLSLMYRLDVSEAKINAALHPGASAMPHEALAHLIIERQKERIRTKQTYKSQNPDLWDWGSTD